uniref:Uncharacterized protein n=1 Tax=Anguilla anguilla TaxID=7936 RepID=A0A0E9W2B8_ANGAN
MLCSLLEWSGPVTVKCVLGKAPDHEMTGQINIGTVYPKQLSTMPAN